MVLSVTDSSKRAQTINARCSAVKEPNMISRVAGVGAGKCAAMIRLLRYLIKNEQNDNAVDIVGMGSRAI